MFKISMRAEYAVRAVLYLSSREPGQVSLVSEISAAQEIPKTYLAKIMQDLVKSGVAKSMRGAGGGFEIARDPAFITVQDIIEIIEGPVALNLCIKGECSREVFCPTTYVWKHAQEKFIEALKSMNMAELAREGRELLLKERAKVS